LIDDIAKWQKKQLMIDYMFNCVSKEERFETIIHDLEVLNIEKKEHATPSSLVPKRNVGCPRKDV
jgi:hypothetical protein